MHGRLQLAYGTQLLHGEYEPPEITRDHVLDEIRYLARNIRFECRYRLLHREPKFDYMDEHYRGFLRARNLRMLFYAAKLTILALKARELLHDRSYPVTAWELRQRLTDPEEVAIVDLVEEWPEPRESYAGDLTELALRLDACARRLVAQLPEVSA